jgi:hypothetical protein
VSKGVPPEWAAAMERKGFTHNGRPSISKLAGATTLAVETVRRMANGYGTPEQTNVNEVADALGVSRIQLNRWIGIARSVEESYDPPPDADLMDIEQRRAVDRIIQLLVEQKRTRLSTAEVFALSNRAEPRLDPRDRVELERLDLQERQAHIEEQKPAARKGHSTGRGRRKSQDEVAEG